MNEPLPTTIWSGEFTLFGVTVRCHLLSNGLRVLDADDVAAVFEAMGKDDFPVDHAEIERFARWQAGR